MLELSRFVERESINELYLDTPYYVYPENAQAEEAYHVIAAALAETDRIGIGRIVMSQRERPVALQPFDKGLLLSTLHTAEEVRLAEFDTPKNKLDPQMVEIATTIVERLAGKFDPKGFRDQYQDALRELVEIEAKGQTDPTCEDRGAEQQRRRSDGGAEEEPCLDRQRRRQRERDRASPRQKGAR